MLTQEPISELIQRARGGDEQASDRLWRLLKPLLERHAKQQLHGNNVAVVMTTSDVLNEAVLQLMQHERGDLGFQNRKHLIGFAVTAMRHIVIDQARKHLRKDRTHVPMEDAIIIAPNDDFDWIKVNDLLEPLAALDPVKAKVVEYKVFGGYTNEEIAELLDLSLATVKRHFKSARAFLMARMSDAPKPQ